MNEKKSIDPKTLGLHFDDSRAERVMEQVRKGELTTLEEVLDALNAEV